MIKYILIQYMLYRCLVYTSVYIYTHSLSVSGAQHRAKAAGEPWVSNQDSYYGLLGNLVRPSSARSGLDWVDLRKSNMPDMPTLASEQMAAEEIRTYNTFPINAFSLTGNPETRELLPPRGAWLLRPKPFGDQQGTWDRFRGQQYQSYIYMHICIYRGI